MRWRLENQVEKGSHGIELHRCSAVQHQKPLRHHRDSSEDVVPGPGGLVQHCLLFLVRYDFPKPKEYPSGRQSRQDSGLIQLRTG